MLKHTQTRIPEVLMPSQTAFVNGFLSAGIVYTIIRSQSQQNSFLTGNSKYGRDFCFT